MFTAKLQYALVLLQELYSSKERGDVAPLTLMDIARKHGMKKEFLEKVARYLRKSEMIEAIKGPGGGYILGPKHTTNLRKIHFCVQPESNLKLAISGNQAKEYITELHKDYLYLLEEVEV